MMTALPNLRKFFGPTLTRSSEVPLSTSVGLTEQDFLASIAHLSSTEQQKKLWYWRLAQRQGIMEVEDRHS